MYPKIPGEQGIDRTPMDRILDDRGTIACINERSTDAVVFTRKRIPTVKMTIDHPEEHAQQRYYLTFRTVLRSSANE